MRGGEPFIKFFEDDDGSLISLMYSTKQMEN